MEKSNRFQVVGGFSTLMPSTSWQSRKAEEEPVEAEEPEAEEVSVNKKSKKQKKVRQVVPSEKNLDDVFLI